MRESILQLSAISERDREIINHVARYRLTTTSVLCSPQLLDLTPRAARKTLRRLSELEYIASYPLIHPLRYYVLGKRATKALGLTSHRSFPLGPQSLPTEYATLIHATQAKQPRQRLKRAEVLSHYPWLPKPLATATHCRESMSGIIELVRVDLGGTPDHIVRKCVRDLHARLCISEFVPVVRSGQFRLVIVTATAEKGTALRQAIDRHELPVGLPIHFSIVPQLLSLTTRQHDA